MPGIWDVCLRANKKNIISCMLIFNDEISFVLSFIFLFYKMTDITYRSFAYACLTIALGHPNSKQTADRYNRTHTDIPRDLEGTTNQ